MDEQEHEQGIAHFVEHITFLGSKKRESLLGTGARSNAYTDFHHTVFHVHAPLINGTTGTPMLPQVGYMHSALYLLVVQMHKHVAGFLVLCTRLSVSVAHLCCKLERLLSLEPLYCQEVFWRSMPYEATASATHTK